MNIELSGNLKQNDVRYSLFHLESKILLKPHLSVCNTVSFELSTILNCWVLHPVARVSTNAFLKTTSIKLNHHK
jgi:hypothetical protein